MIFYSIKFCNLHNENYFKSIQLQITSPGWMHEQVLGPGALGRPRGIG